ncbi:alpha-2-macroglobulin family protein [Tamlana sp. I1]|uniref:alpha-2-macroglobulin family protein n=1 Tax=Tamlana sp. I1 TaxID=2762061 RepID=UPI00189070F1|nr:carboxypeptidase-like regulatory domain-containing protein [Tamlana sp. I1]
MRHALLLIFILLFSNYTQAQKNYDNLWLEVDAFELEGLPKSALKVIKTIEKKAKRDKNHAQLVKIMLFKSKFLLILEEDAQLKIINDFKLEIAKSEAPTKNVLENILAHLYWQYFNQNRSRFYNRTKTAEKVNTADFRTWDLETLFAEIHLHYQNSLQHEALLQKEAIGNYDALLNKKQNSNIYRPTLFDFLSQNALEFYKTDETHITKPAYKFEIDNPVFLAPVETFTKLKIEAKDSTSLQLNALKIYQSLSKFHLKNKDFYELTDVDIDRIKFVYEHATFKNKQNLELETLKQASATLKTHETSGLYNFEIASIYQKLSTSYDAKENTKNRWKAKEAIALCNQVISQFPKSKGAEKCAILKAEIENFNIQIISESHLPIQKPSRLLLSYKNLDSLQFKLYKVSQEQLEKLKNLYRKDQQIEFIDSLKASKSWTSKLRNEHDYQTHRTEIVIPKLENGSYLVVARIKNDVENFAFQNIQITNMALVETETPKYKIFQIIDRNNGAPKVNAQVELTYFEQSTSSMQTKKFTTNNIGEFKVEKRDNWYRNVKLKISHNQDTALFGSFYINKFYNQQNKVETNYNSFIFSDRSIYRPGQTVYFKTIAMQTTDGKSEVLANLDAIAILYNVNGEKVTELKLKTNTYGSTSGEFILPLNGLTGRYRIEFNAGSAYSNLNNSYYFLVEEYKRPKFETKFDPITETFKVNDSITIKGKALAYSGSNITDAKVVYRVHRKVEYPSWSFWYRPWVNSEPQEITHGETTTDGNGYFEITFKALPDQSVDKTSLPIFNYEVSADVTDLNGETHSKTTLVNVGYHALTAKLSLENTLDKTKNNHEINIDTKNLNGAFVPAEGTIKIYKLKAPNSVLRPRPWAAPDYQDLTEKTFKDLFPHDAYADEGNSSHLEKGELVLEKSFNTANQKTLALGSITKWQSGQYLVTLECKDKFGQLVKDEIKTTLFSPSDESPADNQLFTINTNKASYHVGDIAEITIGSSAENLSVKMSIEKNGALIKTEIVKLNNNKKTISIPVTKNDIGGFVVHYSYAAFNSYNSGSEVISVPYPKTNLEIETLTFRDKLQPGSEETWQFKIKGPDGEKVSAEILASMYDASLDIFEPHSWNFNPIYQSNYYAKTSNRAYQSFGIANFKAYNPKYNPKYPVQYYDQFNWFGFDMNNDITYKQYLNTLRSKQESRFSKAVKKGYITGTIYDDTGAPIPGANIIVKGTTRGTTTNFDGNYTLEVSKNEVLEISYIGYSPQEITIGDKNLLHTYLTPDTAYLDEVVVIGYGAAPRSDAKMAVKSISISEEAEEDIDSASFVKIRGLNSVTGNDNLLYVVDGKIVEGTPNLNPKDILSMDVLKDAAVTAIYGSKGANGVVVITTKQGLNPLSQVKIRKNLQETAFFFPHLKTDEAGNISFSFTTPEALTQWKLQLLAHTKSLESSTKSLTTVTQKELMVTPNAPRFLREGDGITISTKIANLTDKTLSGQAFLVLTDAISGKEITANLLGSPTTKELKGTSFTVDAHGNTQVSWQLQIPDNIQAVQYKVVAKSETFSDGEQNTLPVLSNRMLVTETLPMWIKSNESKTFQLDKLKNNTSTTLKNHQLTLEITSNPAWYAVQALPYLMEYPYECNEQTFSRYYANALASHIANSNPKIQDVFKQWVSQDVLISNLEKNEALKSILIQETPWLRDAQSETEQKKRIALLFDLNKMRDASQSSINKLKTNQLNSGAWAWFNGGSESRYITQHIINGFGHLEKLGLSINDSEEVMIEKAISYLDAEFVKTYEALKKHNSEKDLNKDHLTAIQLHYLYMRSFFPEVEQSEAVKNTCNYYIKQIENYWLKRPLYSKGLMALVSFRNGDLKTTEKILKSLDETSITSEELGMYWKENKSSWQWYQAPIETQALLIEAFSEAGHVIQNETKNLETIDNLKIWLLKNKQTNQWKTTKATADAVYALLLQGSDWLSVTDMVDVTIGGQTINPSKLENVSIEAGTGYYKTSWSASEITAKMSEVKLTKKGSGIAWGSLYWQYFEDLDQITSAETPLKLKKKLFVKSNTNTGEVLTEITKNTKLKVGDLVTVRIELQSDRSMEFLHMKDMRAAGLEPVNVISKYKWQDGLGYYESTKDASTNFFFDYLPKGVFVFEYDLRVNNAGDMSNGITTIQSMYAPEFSSHSEGLRIHAD